jgi:hypothetical protein
MPLITSANAREMAAKSRAAKIAYKAQREEDRRIAAEARVKAEMEAKQLPAYAERRLARVRKQLDMLDDEISAELRKKHPDGQRIDRLAAASSRLAEQERLLDGRPMPGSLRPKTDGRRARMDAAEPAAEG